MIKTEGNKKIIECDKCNKTSEADIDNYNEVFMREKWSLNNGKKYKHLCFECLPARSQRAVNFVRDKFKVP